MENGRPGKSKRRAILRLGQRIHGTSDGQHAAGRCQCGVWDRTKGLTRPGSLSGRK